VEVSVRLGDDHAVVQRHADRRRELDRKRKAGTRKNGEPAKPAFP
jgi:hypothetical protein